jgi:hypothetical protein
MAAYVDPNSSGWAWNTSTTENWNNVTTVATRTKPTATRCSATYSFTDHDRRLRSLRLGEAGNKDTAPSRKDGLLFQRRPDSGIATAKIVDLSLVYKRDSHRERHAGHLERHDRRLRTRALYDEDRPVRPSALVTALS